MIHIVQIDGRVTMRHNAFDRITERQALVGFGERDPTMLITKKAIARPDRRTSGEIREWPVSSEAF